MNFARYADDAAADYNYFVVGRRKYTSKGMPATRPDTSTARGVREPKSMVYVALVCEAKGPCTAIVIYIIVQRLKLRDKEKKNLRGVDGDGLPHMHVFVCSFSAQGTAISGRLLLLLFFYCSCCCCCCFIFRCVAAGALAIPLSSGRPTTPPLTAPPLCYSWSLLSMFYLVLLFSSWRQCSGTRRGCGAARA